MSDETREVEESAGKDGASGSEPSGASDLRIALISGIFVVVAALLALGGAAFSSLSQRRGGTEVARQELEANLLLRALENGCESERRSALNFLLDTNLLRDTQIREGLTGFLDSNLPTPRVGSGPPVESSAVMMDFVVDRDALRTTNGELPSEYVRSVSSQLQERLDRAGLEDREIAFVLIFGGGESVDDGRELAEAYGSEVLAQMPGLTGGGSGPVTRFYGTTSGTDQVRLELYPISAGFTEVDGTLMPEVPSLGGDPCSLEPLE
jgi:hypothetical protein